jgi:predicted polyphosphate/ATP-dependent NAD kinase
MLNRLAALSPQAEIVVPRGAMGGDIAKEVGALVVNFDGPDTETTAADTRKAALQLADLGVDLILFAGGDGTARDVAEAVAGRAPLLGVPTGVKMHSGVFAASPEAAGHLAALVAAGDRRLAWREGEIMDIDEAAVRGGRVSAALYGYARTPFERSLVQNAKAGAPPDDEGDLEALAGEIVAGMERGRLYILGPGATIRRIKRRLGFEGTLLGVDVAIDGRLLAADVTETRLLRLLDGARATIMTGVTGGQGFVFGRGNQQISPAVIRKVGLDNLTIVTGRSKLLALDPPCLRVDTGDVTLDQQLAGYRPVRVAPGQTVIMRVAE